MRPSQIGSAPQYGDGPNGLFFVDGVAGSRAGCAGLAPFASVHAIALDARLRRERATVRVALGS